MIVAPNIGDPFLTYFSRKPAYYTHFFGNLIKIKVHLTFNPNMDPKSLKHQSNPNSAYMIEKRRI